MGGITKDETAGFVPDARLVALATIPEGSGVAQQHPEVSGIRLDGDDSHIGEAIQEVGGGKSGVGTAVDDELGVLEALEAIVFADHINVLEDIDVGGPGPTYERVLRFA